MFAIHHYNRLNLRRAYYLAAMLICTGLAGCSLPFLPDAASVSETPTAASTSVPTATALPTASPTPDLAPTALPPPTQIVPMTSTPDPASLTTTPGAPIGAGITLNPAVGEPGDIVIVSGTGFPPNAMVTLHWGPVGGPHGPIYWEVEADGGGIFSVGLIVPPADRWPGGSARVGDLIQLQARSEALGDSYVFMNFTYVQHFDPGTSLVLTYTSTAYGYEIDMPNGWTWDDANTANVRFQSPGGVGQGFVRAVNLTDVAAAIQSVIDAEAPGQTFTTQDTTLGAYAGKEVTTGSGLIFWFIPASGRVYALRFTNDSGQFFGAIAASFRLQ